MLIQKAHKEDVTIYNSLFIIKDNKQSIIVDIIYEI